MFDVKVGCILLLYGYFHILISSHHFGLEVDVCIPGWSLQFSLILLLLHNRLQSSDVLEYLHLTYFEARKVLISFMIMLISNV